MTPTNTPRDKKEFALYWLDNLRAAITKAWETDGDKERTAAFARVSNLAETMMNYSEETIRAALSQPAPIEGDEDEIAEYLAGVAGWSWQTMDANDVSTFRKLARAYAQGRTQSVPDGWKLVPIEPTLEQVIRGQSENVGPVSTRPTYIYKAMLSAAPQPPTRTQNREAQLLEVIKDLSLDLIAARHGLGQKTSPTTAQIKHAEIIKEAHKCKR